MTLVLADTSVWARAHQREVADALEDATRTNALAVVSPIVLELLRSARDAATTRWQARRLDHLRQIELSQSVVRRAREVQAGLADRGFHRAPSPIDLLAAAAAESVEAELWHCDRHFELIARLTGQRVRRLGT